jgi:hypothetical protein
MKSQRKMSPERRKAFLAAASDPLLFLGATAASVRKGAGLDAVLDNPSWCCGDGDFVRTAAVLAYAISPKHLLIADIGKPQTPLGDALASLRESGEAVADFPTAEAAGTAFGTLSAQLAGICIAVRVSASHPPTPPYADTPAGEVSEWLSELPQRFRRAQFILRLLVARPDAAPEWTCLTPARAKRPKAPAAAVVAVAAPAVMQIAQRDFESGDAAQAFLRAHGMTRFTTVVKYRGAAQSAAAAIENGSFGKKVFTFSRPTCSDTPRRGGTCRARLVQFPHAIGVSFVWNTADPRFSGCLAQSGAGSACGDCKAGRRGFDATAEYVAQ